MDGSNSQWRSNARTPSFEESEASASLLRSGEMDQPRYTSLSSKRGNPFSLVGIKNLFFKEEVKPVHSKRTYYVEERRASSASDNSSATDIESRNSSRIGQKKRFKIDARVISDATIGLSDGLTVPFALTAGLSALGNTQVVIYGGLAELIAGAISMGLGGYLGAQSEVASYEATRERTQELIMSDPKTVMCDIRDVFEPYNLPKDTLDNLTSHLSSSPNLCDFVMQFQHCSEPPHATRALTSALTIAMGYFFGGLLPLLPYFFVGKGQVYEGLYISIAVMVVALFVFGYVKTCVVEGWDGGKAVRAGCYGGVQMVVVGSAAAGTAMGLVRAFNP